MAAGGSTGHVLIMPPRAAAQNPRLATGWPSRVCFGTLGIIIFVIPIARPFPDVADHIISAYPAFAVRESIDRFGSDTPNVGEVILVGVAPGINKRLRAARCIFPLRFRRQPSTSPAGISIGLIPGNTDTRLL